jgi:hypothetical protein
VRRRAAGPTESAPHPCRMTVGVNADARAGLRPIICFLNVHKHLVRTGRPDESLVALSCTGDSGFPFSELFRNSGS